MQKKWWNDKVVYQIYPKSFYDTNGDGVGDLRGIIEKLDYLNELGIDIIWLSPVYASPFADQGYDISDYYEIDPRFGKMEDMEELIAKANERKIKIIMDLVVNHCSDEHIWFQKALENPDGEYGKYFYIEEGINGNPPCNWRSYFGGSVWEPIQGTNKYYLHLFDKKQPDLNWENCKVREEVYQMVNWWLEKGIAGFRIDAIINIKKALPFKDYPSDRADGLSSVSHMLQEAKGIGAFLGELNERTFQKYDAFTVGEVFNEKASELPEFIGEHGYFSSMFDFRQTILGKSDLGWYDCTPVTAEMYKNSTFESQERANNIGFMSNIIENHDEPRGVSYYIPEGECNLQSKKMLAAIYFLKKGIPFIYQGQEIGMENVKFPSLDDIDDLSTLDEYQVSLEAGIEPTEAFKRVSFLSRDNSRTPMQWSNVKNAGFSESKPWLMVNPNYQEINVEKEVNDKNSLYYFYKDLIALRKDNEYKDTLVWGTFEPILSNVENILAYIRKGEKNSILVLANYQNSKQTVFLPIEIKKVLLCNDERIECKKQEIRLNGYQVIIAKV
ncbi:MAG: alpha-glucosidase [Velocimicrobium sp.]